eukprot:728217_1
MILRACIIASTMHHPYFNLNSSCATPAPDSKMSMYANSGDSYWKKKPEKKKPPLLIAVIVVLAVVAGAILHNKHSAASRTLTQRRTREQTNETHWKQCESRVSSRQECTSICQPERNSIHRKTMHQACLHGCQQAHVSSTALSCRGKVSSEEEIFQEIGGLAYIHCAKFQATDPKPDVFATCRKYHRAGTKKGFRMGSESLKDILDEEWVMTLSDINAEEQ